MARCTTQTLLQNFTDSIRFRIGNILKQSVAPQRLIDWLCQRTVRLLPPPQLHQLRSNSFLRYFSNRLHCKEALVSGLRLRILVACAFPRRRWEAFTSLKTEIGFSHPFTSKEEEAILNLFRTAEVCMRYFRRKARSWGVTGTQYDVLRILRDAGPQGLTCAEVGKRMITCEPDVTRLLSRLKTLKLIQQVRDRKDRRIVWTQISDAGIELVESIEPVVTRIPVEILEHMTPDEIAQSTRLLELVRVRTNQLLEQDSMEAPVPAEP